MDQRIIDLYDSFTHGGINRRAFLDRLADIAGSSAAALALLPLLQNDYARAAIVPPDDARLAIETVSYDAAGTRISGYLARLKSKGKRPAVIVIHENRGLNPHIQDIARRIALEGFLAYAVDMLSPLGGTPADEDKARDMIRHPQSGRHCAPHRRGGAVPGEARGVRPARSVPSASAGAAVWSTASRCCRPILRRGRLLRSASAGRTGRGDPARRCCCTMPGSTSASTPAFPAYEAALKAANKRYTIYVYPNVNHAFNNDTSNRYDKPAADLAWSRTIAFFKANLGAPPKA